MGERGRRLTNAFVAALELCEHLREGTGFCTALADLKFQIETLEDGYPEWHSASLLRGLRDEGRDYPAFRAVSESARGRLVDTESFREFGKRTRPRVVVEPLLDRPA